MEGQVKKYPMKLEHVFRYGKHKGKTLQWCIDNQIEYVKYLHRKNIITWQVDAWDYFLKKVKGNETYKPTTTIYKRHKRSR